jgi:uncharacterized membrane protein
MYSGITITQTSAVDCCIIARPNCSLSLGGKILAVVSLCTITFSSAVFFAALGAWPILPFAGLEMLLLALAFYQIACHERDYERITFEGDSVVLDIRDNVRFFHAEYNRYWAQVELRCRSVGRQCSLALWSHGRATELGRHLTDDQREQLALELQKRLGH